MTESKVLYKWTRLFLLTISVFDILNISCSKQKGSSELAGVEMAHTFMKSHLSETYPSQCALEIVSNDQQLFIVIM